jgi:hypothetical protein
MSHYSELEQYKFKLIFYFPGFQIVFFWLQQHVEIGIKAAWPSTGKTLPLNTKH